MRRLALRALVGCAVIVASGCIRSDLEEVQPVGSDDGAAPTSVETTIGDTVVTAEGNEVTVLRLESGSSATAGMTIRDAEVEICAADAGDGAPAAPDFFRAVVDDVGYRRPGSTDRDPALPSTRMRPGECERGWVSFPIRDGEEVVGIALLASTRVEWSVE